MTARTSGPCKSRAVAILSSIFRPESDTNVIATIWRSDSNEASLHAEAGSLLQHFFQAEDGVLNWSRTGDQVEWMA